MAKQKKERSKKYEQKLAVNGSFLNIVKAAAKNANSKSAPKDGKKK